MHASDTIAKRPYEPRAQRLRVSYFRVSRRPHSMMGFVYNTSASLVCTYCRLDTRNWLVPETWAIGIPHVESEELVLWNRDVGEGA